LSVPAERASPGMVCSLMQETEALCPLKVCNSAYLFEAVAPSLSPAPALLDSSLLLFV
jgi:hypothetical protein